MMTDTQATDPADPAATIRHDGWTHARQRLFLEALAQSGIVTRACVAVDISPRAAYTLRMRSDGVAFRLGWDGAVLIARARIFDELMTRAFDGQEEIVVREREEGRSTTSRTRLDNRLALGLLTRLDKIAEANPASPGEAALARIVSQDFEAFLDLIENGSSAGAAALFIAARKPLDPAHLAACVLADRQCELREAKAARENPKLPEPGEPGSAYKTPESNAKSLIVWHIDDCPWDRFLKKPEVVYDFDNEKGWDDENIRDDDADQDEAPATPNLSDGWRTNFPPPQGFDGVEFGSFNTMDYCRTLSLFELQSLYESQAETLAAYTQAGEIERQNYFGIEA